MIWTAMVKSEVDNIMEMISSDSSVVFIYPDPATYPYAYEQWTLLRNAVNIGVSTPTLSDLGSQQVVLKFARARS